MSRFKKVLFVFFSILFPIVCFAKAINQPHLVVKVDNQSLVFDKSNINNAHMIKNDDGSYSLDIVLTDNAAKQLTNLTKVNMGKVMSISYGQDQLVSKVTIQTPLGGAFQIAHFPEKEGNDLIDSLKQKTK